VPDHVPAPLDHLSVSSTQNSNICTLQPHNSIIYVYTSATELNYMYTSAT
jgi:hypothetical protein